MAETKTHAKLMPLTVADLAACLNDLVKKGRAHYPVVLLSDPEGNAFHHLSQVAVDPSRATRPHVYLIPSRTILDPVLDIVN